MPRRIGDVARRAGVGVETVRFYEREGLIDRPDKPVRGWRDYDDAALGQLGQIRRAQSMGLTRWQRWTRRSRRLKTRRTALATWLKQCRARKRDCPLYDQINALTRKRR